MKIPVECRVRKTPVEGRAKEIPEGQVMKTPVERRVKKTDPSSRQGRRPMT
jgi:hypothetical protein